MDLRSEQARLLTRQLLTDRQARNLARILISSEQARQLAGTVIGACDQMDVAVPESA